MTYEDIADWAEENYPLENYDEYQDWLRDVSRDFENSGHAPNGLPESAIDLMAGRWHRYREPELEEATDEPFTEDYQEDLQQYQAPKPRHEETEALPSFGLVPESIPSEEPVYELPPEPIRRPEPIYQKPLVNREKILATQSPKGLQKAERFASVKRFIRGFRKRK